jgi:hypothetical protein
MDRTSLPFAYCSNKPSKANAALAWARVVRCFEVIVQSVVLALLSVVCLSNIITPGTIQAATVAAVSCSHADVSAAVQAAQNGDTVLIPAGTCTWSHGLGSNCGWGSTQDTSFCRSSTPGDTKYITIQGAGIGQTIIIDAVPRDGSVLPRSAINWQLKSGGLSRITGIEMRGTVGNQYTTPGVCQGGPATAAPLSFWGSTNQFRLDHNKIVQHGGCIALIVGPIAPSNVRGVIDHNFFDFTTEAGDPDGIISNIYNFHLSWGDIGDNGDNSWAQPDTVGTAEALFYENNVFYNAQTRMLSGGTFRQFYTLTTEAANGARIVVRYNNFRSTVYTHHGTGSAIRSTRQFEVYENDFTGSTGCVNNIDATGCGPWNLYGNTFLPVVGSRGGVGVVFNNRLTYTNGATTSWTLNVVDERTTGAPNSGNMFGACSGSNVWDQNSTAMGRLCIDQPGAGYGDLVASTPTTPGCPGGPWPINVTRGCIQAWPRQVAQPSYEWGNTNNGMLATACLVSPVLGLTPIIPGIDCIHGQRPGYTPYTYPHPLTTGTSASSSAPDAPTGLTVR